MKELRNDTQISWPSCLYVCCLLGDLSCTPPNLFFFRQSILEPEGTVEIKFRKKDLIKTMRRIDPIYQKLVQQLGKSV